MHSFITRAQRWMLALSLGLGVSLAQAQSAPAPADSAPPAASAQAAAGGIKSANIFEIAPDADKDANYTNQTNGERKLVQPGNNAPMWRDVGKGVTGYSSLPYPESGNLIQGFVQYPGSSVTNAGEAWRQVRNNWIIPYGGSLLLIVALAIAMFYWRKGTIGLHGAETGRLIERFTYVERAAHWVNAIAFVVLAVPGYWFWPSVLPSMNAWVSLLAVGIMSTGLAYVLYFRLIVKTGAARTMTLTYLIPLFANLIGVFALDEVVTGPMLMAAVLILLGTAMASGLFPTQPALLRPEQSS